jgi:hypothetical protein
MGGYVYFARNNNNMCSIASYAIYPIVKGSATTTTKPKTTPTLKPVTTTKPKVTTTTKSSLTTTKATTKKTTTKITTTKKSTVTDICYNGDGYYAYSGCQSYYYCSQTYYQSSCPYGYLFDQENQICTTDSIDCVTPSSDCSDGTGWYSYPGCFYVYYCDRTIYDYTAPTGYLFDQSTASFQPASTYTCPF